MTYQIGVDDKLVVGKLRISAHNTFVYREIMLIQIYILSLNVLLVQLQEAFLNFGMNEVRLLLCSKYYSNLY